MFRIKRTAAHKDGDLTPSLPEKQPVFSAARKHCIPVLLFFLMICLFLYPQTVFNSLLAGFEMAFCRVIPAVFPMMVLSGMLMESPLSAWLGILFLPCTRALGIRSRSAATVLFLGFLGGFAVLAQGIDQLCRSQRITRRQAELLLCAGMNAGPSFILLSVGHRIFGSTALGVLLLFSVFTGNIVSALLLAAVSPRQAPCAAQLPQCSQESFPASGLFTRTMHKAVSSCTALCGYIAFFCLLCAFVRLLIPALSGLFYIFLEVTNGVAFAAKLKNPARLLWTVAALSWSGLSIQLQAKALLPAEVTLRRFYQSRLIAVPCSLTFYGIGVRLFPQLVPAMAGAEIRGSRFSLSIVVSFFLMVGAFLYECTPKSSLRSRQNPL